MPALAAPAGVRLGWLNGWTYSENDAGRRTFATLAARRGWAGASDIPLPYDGVVSLNLYSCACLFSNLGGVRVRRRFEPVLPMQPASSLCAVGRDWTVVLFYTLPLPPSPSLPFSVHHAFSCMSMDVNGDMVQHSMPRLPGRHSTA